MGFQIVSVASSDRRYIWKSERDREGPFIMQKIRGENDMETIIAALISASAAIIVCAINNRTQQQKNEVQQEKTRALMEYKLDELTKRVEKHNNTIERTYRLEQDVSVMEEQIKVANHRIQDLERKGESS